MNGAFLLPPDPCLPAVLDSFEWQSQDLGHEAGETS